MSIVLSNNQIEKLGEVKSLKNLKKLNLSHNKIGVYCLYFDLLMINNKGSLQSS